MKLLFDNDWLRRGINSDPNEDALAGPNLENEMTTTVKVHVNGKYRATVTQDDREPVIVEGNYNGGSGEKSFYLSHPAKGTFVVSEEYVKDGDERQST